MAKKKYLKDKNSNTRALATNELGLEKPLGNENYDVNVFNNNMDKIDVAIKNVKNDLSNIDLTAERVEYSKNECSNVDGALDKLFQSDSENKTSILSLDTEMQEVKQSVSNGKKLVANAITDKGIPTLATDTFNTMANNIMELSSGKYSLLIDFYAQLEQPTNAKKGDVWIKTNATVNPIYSVNKPQNPNINDLWVSFKQLFLEHDIDVSAYPLLDFGINKFTLNLITKSVVTDSAPMQLVSILENAYSIAKCSFSNAKLWDGVIWANVETYYYDGSTWILVLNDKPKLWYYENSASTSTSFNKLCSIDYGGKITSISVAIKHSMKKPFIDNQGYIYYLDSQYITKINPETGEEIKSVYVQNATNSCYTVDNLIYVDTNIKKVYVLNTNLEIIKTLSSNNYVNVNYYYTFIALENGNVAKIINNNVYIYDKDISDNVVVVSTANSNVDGFGSYLISSMQFISCTSHGHIAVFDNTASNDFVCIKKNSDDTYKLAVHTVGGYMYACKSFTSYDKKTGKDFVYRIGMDNSGAQLVLSILSISEDGAVSAYRHLKIAPVTYDSNVTYMTIASQGVYVDHNNTCWIVQKDSSKLHSGKPIIYKIELDKEHEVMYSYTSIKDLLIVNTESNYYVNNPITFKN